MGCICWQENKLELANKSFVQRNGSHSSNSSCVSTRGSFRTNIKVLYITTGCNQGLFELPDNLIIVWPAEKSENNCRCSGEAANRHILEQAMKYLVFLPDK